MMWLKKSKSGLSIKIKLKLALWTFVQNTLFKYSPLIRPRIWLLNLFGANVNKSCFIHSSAKIYMPWNLKMGEKSSIDFNVIIYNLDNVIIGNFVSIAYMANINTGSHDFTDPHLALVTKPVMIKDGAFIGADVYISPGVSIGLMTVIGARSVITKDMPDNYICYGHPCVPHKFRNGALE
jgi:putative colanic acid biosynthesis acetyltransferase WcaF